MEPLAAALSSARAAGRPITVPYLLVDRRRRSRLGGLLDVLRDAGADAVELGFPFSDPIADGPVLEAAAARALEHGTGWQELLVQARIASAKLPTAVMTYANPVWHHGLDSAVGALARAGVTGLIVPDLSFEESAPWSRAGHRHGVSLVQLAAPAASPERVGRIARASEGFLYLVSRYGTTGTDRPTGSEGLAPLVRASHRSAPDLAVLVGFGIRDRPTALAARASGADGVVVGSALEERIARGDSLPAIRRWFAGLSRTAVPRAEGGSP